MGEERVGSAGVEARTEKVWGHVRVRLEGPSMDGSGACDGHEESQEPRGRVGERVGGLGGLGQETVRARVAALAGAGGGVAGRGRGTSRRI